MKDDDSVGPPGLQALCRQAGRRAAGWQAAADFTPIGARAPSPRRPPLLKIGLLGGSSLLVLAVAAAPFLDAPASADGRAPPAAVPVAAAAPWPLTPPPGSSAAALPAGPGTPEPVRWQRGELVVDFEQVPLVQAIGSLAGATRTTVAGLELLRQPVTVTLHRRFGDAATAWQQLLQGRAGFGIGCGASDCRVWITGETASRGAAAAASGADDGTPADRAAVPGDAPPTDELERSQPGGSC